MSIAASSRSTNFKYAIRNVVAAADALKRDGREVISLNIGDPQAFGFRPPAFVVEPVERALRDGFTGYASSAGLYEAREAVSIYAENVGVATNVDDVLMTSGASEGADLVLTALLNAGDEILLPVPGYPLYDAILNKLDAKGVGYRLREDAAWQPDLDEIESLITPRTRALLLINPSNPTGAIIDDETTKQLIELAAKHRLLVISDEVYRDLCFEKAPIAASVLAENSGVPVITLESLSKTHMLSGWRVGWMRFTNSAAMPQLIDAIHRLASGRLCSPTPAQYAVRPALTMDNGSVAEFVSEIRIRRDIAVRRVSETEGISCSVPQAAFYLMVKVADLGGRTDEQFALDLLQETGVLVVHGSGFGQRSSDGYFRLVYLPDAEVLNRAFDAIKLMVERRPFLAARSSPGLSNERPS